jgi:hypothetical protein
MTRIVVGGRPATKSEMAKRIATDRETIAALKSALLKRRNPEGDVLTRATVEELMIELEQRPRAEVDAYVERNKPTHDSACEDRERRFPGTGCTCKGVIPENVTLIEVPRGRLQ